MYLFGILRCYLIFKETLLAGHLPSCRWLKLVPRSPQIQRERSTQENGRGSGGRGRPRLGGSGSCTMYYHHNYSLYQPLVRSTFSRKLKSTESHQGSHTESCNNKVPQGAGQMYQVFSWRSTVVCGLSMAPSKQT